MDRELQDKLNQSFQDVCVNGDLQQVKELIEQGANVDEGMWGAARSGNIEVVKFLHQNGADVNIYACRSGHLDVVKYFIEHGADLDTAIAIVANNGKLEVVKYLHQNGADLDTAIDNASDEIKDELINYKTNIEEKALIESDLNAIKGKLKKHREESGCSVKVLKV